jgi:HEAT repeat protein
MQNYRDAVLSEASVGKQKSWCSRCHRSTPHQLVTPKQEKAADLVLPLRSRSTDRGAPSGRGEEHGTGSVASGTGADPLPLDALDPTAVGGAAGFVLELVSRVRRLGDVVVEEATASLLSLGDQGQEAARVALTSTHGPTVLVGARVFLRGGGGAGARAVLERLRGRLPTGVGPSLLRELLKADPVLVGPRALADLLDHPHSKVRATAHTALARADLDDHSDGPGLVSLLQGCLASQRTDTRRRAIDLLEGLADPAALEALLGCLGDASASVSTDAVHALARAPQPDTAARLTAIAFDGPWLLRREAYALLALVEREDRLVEPLFRARHVEPLLAAAASRDPFVSGVAALALAGIGFRAPPHVPCLWLDRDVPERLVYALSGSVFHNDFSALQAPSARRLTMLSGQTFGTRGPDWLDWWLAEGDHFRARRATLAIAPEEEVLLTVSYRDTGDDPRLFTFIGPGVEEMADGPLAPVGELFRMTADQCRDLVALLRRRGLLDAECLPGLRGQTRAGMRSLEISLGAGGSSKGFTFGPNQSEPWFEVAAEALIDLERRSRWQVFPPPDLNDAPRTFWIRESAWWDLPRTPVQRATRLKTLILTSLPGLSPSRRSRGGELLAELYERAGAAEAGDFPTFLNLIREEPFLDGRTRLWLTLARRAAGLEGDSQFASRFDNLDETRPAGLPPQSIALAGDLVDVLELRFGGEAASEIAALLAACGPKRVVTAARDPRPILRVAAAALLLRGGQPDDGDLLLGLLQDAVPDVEMAAVQAIGEGRLESGRTQVFLRARQGRGPVRRAALEAVGKLGGGAAVEVLLDGLSSAVQGIPEAAARGLVHLGDPATAPALVSMLGGTRRDEFLDPIRMTLLGLGESAHTDLLVVLRGLRPNVRPSNVVREAALLLARQNVAAAAAPLMLVLADEPQNGHVARELAILTGVDFRDAQDPAARWKEWWNTVLHHDAVAWMRAGAERAGFAAPPDGALENPEHPQRLDAFFFLTDLLQRGPDHLAERARRLLEEQMGRDLPVPRAGDVDRARWFMRLRDEAH